MTTRRLTVGQALVEFLAAQWTVDGDVRERTVPALLGIFGHGNVAGLGQALRQYNAPQPDLLPYHQARNEQAMVHQAVGYARVHPRPATLAAAAPVSPGAANPLARAARPACGPGRPWPPRTGCPRCCCRRTPSPPGSPTRSCSSWSTRTTPASR